jgi:hypothetical protein
MDYKNPSKMPKYSAGSATQAAPDSEAPSTQEIFKLRLS